MAVQSFSYKMALLLTKYGDAGQIVSKKNSGIFGKNILLL